MRLIFLLEFLIRADCTKRTSIPICSTQVRLYENYLGNTGSYEIDYVNIHYSRYLILIFSGFPKVFFFILKPMMIDSNPNRPHLDIQLSNKPLEYLYATA